MGGSDFKDFHEIAVKLLVGHVASLPKAHRRCEVRMAAPRLTHVFISRPNPSTDGPFHRTAS